MIGLGEQNHADGTWSNYGLRKQLQEGGVGMRLNDLTRYGIPQRIIEAWRQRQGDILLPVQRRAIRCGLLKDNPGDDRPGNMIISAPTSSGKSFCAELAAVRALVNRQKALLLFPLKSLAEEKYRLFQQTYEPLGIRCLIATGDHPENDEAFNSGAYHLAVAINEKFDLLLTHQLDALKNIGLVVVDEVQMISEPGRGAILERLLTKMLAATYQPKLVALSAVLADRTVEPLAAWLSAHLVEETLRPRDLIRGVAAEGKLCYRSYNDGHDGNEPFDACLSSANFDPLDEEALAAFARRMKNDDASTLVFLKSRSDTVSLALKLAALIRRPPAKQALGELADEEPSVLLGWLTQALQQGVAFHNSDLSSRQRQVIERAFLDKEINVLCSTTTLALGVNLPADVVYLETVKYTSGTYGGRPDLVPISRAEFENMSGRAGRFGRDTDQPGRAIVLAESALDQEILWETYIGPVSSQPFVSAFESLPLEDWLLNMIVAGLGTSMEQLEVLLSATLRAALEKSSRWDLEKPLAALRENNLIRFAGADGELAATACGAAAAITGLTVAEAIRYLKIMAGGYPETPFGWTCLALSSPHWTLPPAALSWYEQANNLPVRKLYQRFDHSVEEAAYLLPESHRREPLSYRASASLKCALLLDEWCRLVPVRKLEERFQMHLGQIQSLGETAAHLVSALGKLIAATDQESPISSLPAEHAFSLRFGLPASMQPLHRCLGGVLSRSEFLSVHEAGAEIPEEFFALPDETLSKLVRNNDKLKIISALRDDLKEEVEMQTLAVEPRTQFYSRPRSIEIDGDYEQDRYLVRIDGFPVRLTGKSFKYLVKLAWSRLNGDNGWIYKEDIEVGFNQARYLYRMKNEICSGFKSTWPIIENNRLGYYRLDIDPEKIRINAGNLRSHPDYEVRSLFEIDTVN
jgi:helicase